MTSPTGKLSQALRSNPPISTPDMSLRLATVLNVSAATGLLDIALGGNVGEILYDVEHMSNYVPSYGDEVWCIQSGPDLIVWDRVGTRVFTDTAVDLYGYPVPNINGPYYLDQRGPSLWEQSGGLNSGTGDGSTPDILPLNSEPEFYGASNLVTVLVGQSKLVAVGLSCFIGLTQNEATPVSEGAGYVGWTGAPQENPGEMYTVNSGPWFGLKYAGPVPSGALMSRWSIGLVPVPGLWTFAMSFSAHGSPVQFSHRELWVLTL